MKDIVALIVIFILGIIAYKIFDNVPLIRLLIVILLISGFIIWGIRNSIQNKNNFRHIFFEYIILGLVGLALLFFLLYYNL